MKSGQFLSDCSQPPPGDDSVLGYLFGVKRHYVWTERERGIIVIICARIIILNLESRRKRRNAVLTEL